MKTNPFLHFEEYPWDRAVIALLRAVHVWSGRCYRRTRLRLELRRIGHALRRERIGAQSPIRWIRR